MLSLIVLTPLRIQRGDAVRAKLAELALDDSDIAAAGQATVLVYGDADLLALQDAFDSANSCRIITPAAFAQSFRPGTLS